MWGLAARARVEKCECVGEGLHPLIPGNILGSLFFWGCVLWLLASAALLAWVVRPPALCAACKAMGARACCFLPLLRHPRHRHLRVRGRPAPPAALACATRSWRRAAPSAGSPRAWSRSRTLRHVRSATRAVPRARALPAVTWSCVRRVRRFEAVALCVARRLGSYTSTTPDETCELFTDNGPIRHDRPKTQTTRHTKY